MAKQVKPPSTEEHLAKMAEELVAEADKRGVRIVAKLNISELGVVPYPLVVLKDEQQQSQDSDTKQSTD